MGAHFCVVMQNNLSIMIQNNNVTGSITHIIPVVHKSGREAYRTCEDRAGTL